LRGGVDHDRPRDAVLHVADVALQSMLRVLVDQLVANRLDHEFVSLLQLFQLLVESL
jgi:hypothetical protein